MPLKAVAELLGPPRYWAPVWESSLLPLFWGYNHLELRFSERAPHRLVWLKIHDASSIEGKSFALCNKLRLSMDSYLGTVKPSAFLQDDVWGTRKVLIDVQLIAGDLQLHIDARPVQLLFNVAEDDVDDIHALTEAFHRRDWHPIVAAFEQVSRLRGVYCFSPAEWRDRRWRAPSIETDRRSYLAEIAHLSL